MKVLKFGGSSVATPERIRGIGALIAKRYAKEEKLTIVFSAFGGVTDTLIECAKQAAQGKKEYIEVYNSLRKRHQDACNGLLGSDLKTQEELFENFDILKDLLKGVHLVREASPRTMDYILSFGELNSSLILSLIHI